MMLTGCWLFTGTLTQNGVVTVGNNKTTPLLPDSLLGEFTKASESWISDTTHQSSSDGLTIILVSNIMLLIYL